MNGRDCQELLGWAAGPLGLRARGFRRVRGQVAKRVGKRLAALGLADAQAYRAYLATHPAEWALLDSLCRVTISRFFRDGPVWRFLVEEALPRLAAGGARAWSVGCASGEEAYSLALAARLARVPLEVLGTDADGALLARAARGVYPAGTLRELPEALAQEAFEPAGEGEVRLRDAFRAGVRFVQQDVRCAWPEGSFQLVLCRNVVCTYFAPELQRQVLAELAARLLPGGLLVLGKGEALPEELPGFVLAPCGWPVYRKEAPAGAP